MGSRLRGNDSEYLFANRSLRCLRKPIIQRISCAAHGADRVLLAFRVEQFAQATDVHVHSALVDINVAAPDAVEQLLAAEDAARMLQEKFQQAIFGGTEVDRTARARDAAFFTIEFDVAKCEDRRETFRAGASQQAFYPRQQFRNGKRLDDVVVGPGGKTPHPLA